MFELIFWVSALGLAHTYLFYPLALIAWDGFARAAADFRYLSGGKDRRASRPPWGLPRVSVLVAAWNEEAVIGEKVENTLALDYPDDRLDVVIGSDGSDDGTDEIVNACEDKRVRLSPGERKGKVGVLNRIVPLAWGDILVFSDANTIFDKAALMKLVRPFADPAVGLVCGRLRLFNPSKKNYEESAYWKYETFLKFHEGKRGAVMGANGGIFALRRSLYEQLPPDTVVEDFVIAGKCLLRGYKVVYDPEALAFEETTEDYGKERVRRARIAAGNFQALSQLRGLLHPRRGFVAFAFLSHKVLRWLGPLLLLSLLVTSFALRGQPLYFAALCAQLAFYALALFGRLGLEKGALGRLASFARYFTEMNWGVAEGFMRWLRGTQKVTWERTARRVQPPA